MSHPTWVRGLKPSLSVTDKIEDKVAPYVGAWIETRRSVLALAIATSHPTWVRGLKQAEEQEGDQYSKSHPTWVRGLKRALGSNQSLRIASHPTWVRGLKPKGGVERVQGTDVAPYVGAWIETFCFYQISRLCTSHPTWVRGLKHADSRSGIPGHEVAPYVGAWIETPPTLPTRSICDGRTLRGCVD